MKNTLAMMLWVMAFATAASAQILTIDQNFGFNGFTRIDFTGESNNDEPHQLIATADGFLAGGTTVINNGDYRAAVAKLSSQGTLNAAFGNGTGKILAKFNTRSEGLGFLVQQDGKIIGVGRDNESNAGSSQKPYIFRLLANGEVDTTFADSGYVRKRYDPISGGAHFGAVQQVDGKIVAFGHSYGNINGGAAGFGTMRFNQDGTLDATYSEDGMSRITVGQINAQRGSGLLQPDGKVLIAGATWTGSTHVITLVRFDSTGAPDLTFGDQGLATSIVACADGRVTCHLQQDGKIIVTYTNTSPTALATARFNSNGTLDQSFGILGSTVMLGLTNTTAYSSAIDAGGNIIVAGRSATGTAIVARFSPTGVIDTVFGGQTFALAAGATNYFTSISLQGSNIVGLGYDFGSRGGDFAVVRLTEQSGSVGYEAADEQAFQLYPNPTRNTIMLKVNIPESGDVAIRILDLTGRELTRKNYGRLSPGVQDLVVDVSDLGSGTYLAALTSANSIFTKCFILAK